MSRGFPSMTALLGLLAVAGYQNRDKIAEMLGGLGQNTPAGTGQSGNHRYRAKWDQWLARSVGQESRQCQCRRDPERRTR